MEKVKGSVTMRQKSTIRVGGPGCAGIAPGHPSATPTHQHQGTLSLVIPALRQGVRGQGEKSFPLPYDRRLFQGVQRQVFAPPGTPFVTASADKPGSRPLTCRDSQGAGGIQRAGGDIYRDEPRGVTLNTDERSLIIVIRHANSCIYRDASRIINPCPASMETQQ